MDQHRLILDASKQVLKYLMYMVSTLTESGPPYSYRTRGYLSSFPGTWIPLTHEKDTCIPPAPPPPSQALVTIGNYKKHPLFWAFSANLPEQCQILEPVDWSWHKIKGNVGLTPLITSTLIVSIYSLISQIYVLTSFLFYVLIWKMINGSHFEMAD